MVLVEKRRGGKIKQREGRQEMLLLSTSMVISESALDDFAIHHVLVWS